jgi:hypothetical protein
MKNKAFEMVVKLAFLLCLLMPATVGAAGYTLTVSAQGSGTVTPDNTNNPHPAGVKINITATPNTGWYFANWSGDATGTINPLQVTMNSSMVITGNFLAYPTYMLTLATNGQGTIALNPAGGSYLSNTVVIATATPATGWVFTAWSGGTNSSVNPLSLTINTNLSLTGTFAQLPDFDLQPLSVTNAVGSNVIFSAHAAGSAPLGYQWFFSGGSLTSATNTTLTLTNVSSGKSGNYWIIATNSYGSATSSVVSLTLTNAGGSTNVVNSPDEASLRAAIKIGGWVGFGFNGTITITNTINITNKVILDGTGVAATISGGNAVRLFYVAPGVTFCATNLTLANGSNYSGGAIYNDGSVVTLVACTLTNNQAYQGGAIYNNGGTLAMFRSAFSNNAAAGEGCSGGAAYQASGSLVVSNCIFSFNSAHGGEYGPTSAGGALSLSSGNITIARSQFLMNTANSLLGYYSGASAFGGAVYSTATLTVYDSSFVGNYVLAENKVVYPRSPGRGNGFGGAIYNSGTAVLNRCLIYSNYAQGGQDGAYVGFPSIGGPGLGGGIYNASQFTATNCTIAFNSTIGGTAGEFMHIGTSGTALGGGVFNNTNAMFIAMNLTIASNSCSSPPGQYSTNGIAAGTQIANTNGTLSLHNSLIAYGGTNGNAYGTITDVGYNICSDGSANLNSGSSYSFTDPKLGPLADYGGPTLCMALLPNSSAIDFGDSLGAPATDQRGFVRPFGDGVDMGAYEYGSYQPVILCLYAASTGNNVLVCFTASPSLPGLYRLQASTNLSTWTDLNTNGPFASSTNISQTISKQEFKLRFFRVLVQ